MAEFDCRVGYNKDFTENGSFAVIDLNLAKVDGEINGVIFFKSELDVSYKNTIKKNKRQGLTYKSNETNGDRTYNSDTANLILNGNLNGQQNINGKIYKIKTAGENGTIIYNQYKQKRIYDRRPN